MEEKDRYDVVVVGAGPLGLASAFHLAHELPELSVLVVDARSSPGEGSMGASNSMVRDLFSSPENRLLARSSIRFYRSLMDEQEELRTPVPLLDLFGYLWLLPESERGAFHELLGRQTDPLDARALEPGELRSCPGIELAPSRWYEDDRAPPPEPITGGVFARFCGAVAPELLARFYFEEARRQGVDFLFGACVQRLSFEGREEILLHERTRTPFAFQEHVKGRLRVARVDLGDGRSVRTERVVVAAGAWAEKLLYPFGFATACAPRAQSLFSLSGAAVDELLDWEPPLDPIDTAGGKPRMPFLVLPTGATLKPVFRQRQIWAAQVDTVTHPVGTLEDPARDGRLDFDMRRLGEREAFATDLAPAITPYLPSFGSSRVRLERSWGGYYCMSPDGLPVLTVERYGVVFVGGDSGSGIMKADALGRLVAARLAGRTHGRLASGDSFLLDKLSLASREVEPERLVL